MWTETSEVVASAISSLGVENACASIANAGRLITKTSSLFTEASGKADRAQAFEVVRRNVLTSGVVQTWLIKRAKRCRLIAIFALVAVDAFAVIIGFNKIEKKWKANAE
jgi:hypothetical protein